MDGNRRWAMSKGLPKIKGHEQGAKNIKTAVEFCLEKKIPYLTIWGLSTDNLKERQKNEIQHIFRIAQKALDQSRYLKKHQIRVRMLGDLNGLPKILQKIFSKLVQETKNYTSLNLSLAFNYGGRDELLRAIKKIVQENYMINKIDQHLVNQHLDTHGIPDPDLIIRTGGKKRLSGFLPWQSVYSELYFTDCFWPELSKTEIEKALVFFSDSKRNLGK